MENLSPALLLVLAVGAPLTLLAMGAHAWLLRVIANPQKRLASTVAIYGGLGLFFLAVDRFVT